MAWNALLDKHGLVFDSDPRKMSQAGQVQLLVDDGDDPPDKERDE